MNLRLVTMVLLGVLLTGCAQNPETKTIEYVFYNMSKDVTCQIIK